MGGDIIPSGVGGVNLSVGPIQHRIERWARRAGGSGRMIVPVLRDEVIQAVRQTLRVDSRRPSPA